jgi:hypothetical protein
MIGVLVLLPLLLMPFRAYGDGSVSVREETDDAGGHFAVDDDDYFSVFADNIDSEFLPKGENSM